MYSFIRALLFTQDPEKVHLQVMNNLQKWYQKNPNHLFLKNFKNYSKYLSIKKMGITFANPIGLAAGFDKNAEWLTFLEKLGFGFIEVGSVTAKPCQGNPQPRLFRLPKDKALLNRMGLNNEGADIIAEKLKNRKTQIPIGVNIAKTNDPNIYDQNAISDILYSYNKLAPVADYITLNISCPNTIEKKTFEEPGSLNELLGEITSARNQLFKSIPILIKLSPVNVPSMIDPLIEVALNHSIDGVVIANTVNNLPKLKTSTNILKKIGSGGLSGKPLQKLVDPMIKHIRKLSSTLNIIGTGGIDSTSDIKLKMQKGADLVQMYTGFVYQGPFAINRMLKDLSFNSNLS